MTDYQSSPFIKQLAANDRPTRDRAVSSLQSYLSSKRTFTRLELLKLWKGLFYCMWHSDRPLPQQRLASTLSNLQTPLTPANFLTFTSAFWETIVREYPGIDVLRLDKFLLLIRAWVAQGLRYLRNSGWEEGLVRGWVGELMQDGDGGDDEERERRGGSGLGGAVSPACLKVANGLRYHLIDIYVDEIEKLSPPTSEEEGTAFEQANYPLVELVSPFENLVLKSPTKLVRERVREMLLDERLERWGYLSPNVKRKGKKGRKGKVDGSDAEMGDDGEDSDEEWGGFGN